MTGLGQLSAGGGTTGPGVLLETAVDGDVPSGVLTPIDALPSERVGAAVAIRLLRRTFRSLLLAEKAVV